jgi:hypothetical protein
MTFNREPKKEKILPLTLEINFQWILVPLSGDDEFYLGLEAFNDNNFTVVIIDVHVKLLCRRVQITSRIRIGLERTEAVMLIDGFLLSISSSQ